MEPQTGVTRIKLKIGDHEFEAEGPAETVERQFDIFKELISAMPRQLDNKRENGTVKASENKQLTEDSTRVSIEKVLHVSGRVVSLTALPTSTEDAALLIMLGQKDLRNNESVTGQEIGDGLALSGRKVPRVDRIMERALNDSLVLKSGVKRSTRYRMTNQGLTKALNIARDLIASLP